jgi:hypothetical protein
MATSLAFSDKLRDADIRQPFEDWLWSEHACYPDTGIIHEFKMPRPSARADIAVVNGKLAGFEIKSDRDNLSRLPRQIAAFSRIFDVVSVVSTNRHIGKLVGMTPPWWGIIKMESGRFVQFRAPTANPSLDVEALLYTLNRSELICILASFDRSSGMRSKRIDQMVEAVQSRITPGAIAEAVRNQLKARCQGINSQINLRPHPRKDRLTERA